MTDQQSTDKVNKKHSAPGKNTEYRAIWKNLGRRRQTFAKRWTFTLERDVASRRGRPRTLKQTVGIDLILVIISVILFTISISTILTIFIALLNGMKCQQKFHRNITVVSI